MRDSASWWNRGSRVDTMMGVGGSERFVGIVATESERKL